MKDRKTFNQFKTRLKKGVAIHIENHRTPALSRDTRIAKVNKEGFQAPIQTGELSEVAHLKEGTYKVGKTENHYEIYDKFGNLSLTIQFLVNEPPEPGTPEHEQPFEPGEYHNLTRMPY